MKFFSTSAIFALLLTSLSTATPTPSPSSSSACLTYAQASDIVKSYRAIIMKTGNVTAEGEKLFAPSFTFSSDSLGSLLGYPVICPPFSPLQTLQSLTVISWERP